MNAFSCLALLALTASVKAGHLNCDSSDADDFRSSGSANVIPKVVTYGEPCACSIPLPYSVQVPKVSPEISVSRRNYGYSVQDPTESAPANVGFRVPIKIETPYISESRSDTLRGKSYSVNVQGSQPSQGPIRHSFNFDIQKSVPIQRQSKRVNYGIEVQPAIISQDYNFGPLPYAVQTPVEHRHVSSRLTGLTSKVDRILVPASDIYSCPPDQVPASLCV